MPVRRASWTERDGRVVLKRPKPARRGLGATFDWLGHWLSISFIRLDEKGSETWRLLDGQRTVAEVAELVRERFGEEVEPAEERIGHLVRIFHHQELVTYPALGGEPDTAGSASMVGVGIEDDHRG